MMQETYFGIWLAKFRKQRNLTQADLAEVVDRSVDAISNLLRGKSLPCYEMMAMLCQNLGVDPAMMFENGTQFQAISRRGLMARLNAVSSELNESGLMIAVEQIEILAKHKQ